jgi:hypothetical protein
MAASLCGGVVSSRRGLLASLWFLVTVLTAVAFLLALIFTLSADSGNDNDDGYYNNDGEGNKDDEEGDAVMAVTSRAMAFAALWTAVLATLMGIFGTVILGWQSPTGQYYTCCSTSVHRTTPLALGSFIGALLMFANLTLVCSVLFGEFEVSVCMVGYSTTFQFPVHLTCCPFLWLLLFVIARFAIINEKEMMVEGIMMVRETLPLGDRQWRLAFCACS